PAHEAQDRDVGEPESPDPGRRQDGRKAKRLHDRVTCDPMTGTEHSEAVDALVDVGGVRLHTRRVGTGPPVVVLHGGPGADYADRVGRLALVAPAPLTARWREEFERRLSARLADPRIVRARAELSGSGLAQRDPEKYRRLAFALSVAGYFKDPSRAKELTPFRVVARTQQAVWQSLGNYDLRDRLR